MRVSRVAPLTLLVLSGTLMAGAQRNESAPSAPSRELRILAYNIRHGRGMDDVVDLERAAAVIRRLRPDLVALQEIDSATTRTGGVDQASRLGELTGLHSAFGAFMPYRGGAYGMAVLSRFPIREVVNHRLPDGEEPRSALAIRVTPDGGRDLVFVGIHLYRTERERLAQIDRLLEALREEAAPVILAGDFNSLPGSPVMRRVAEGFTLPAKRGNPMTFPADFAAREIDFIAVRAARRIDVLEYQVIDERLASDHRPVLMVIRLQPD